MVGKVVSHYKILEKLGEGGMGVVYKAEDTTLNRHVALKFLPPDLTCDKDARERFIHEAKAAAMLNHPNICTVYGIEEHDGQSFIVMEFIEGQTLRERTTEIPLKQAVGIGIQIAEGLAAAHEMEIVHRDLKPENIMLQKDGHVKIMDFGLARVRGASKLTKPGTILGTVGYMSPEQVEGREIDHQSDIFSLGVLIYELVSGRHPFGGQHEAAILYEIVNVSPSPIALPKGAVDPELSRIVFGCLEKDPAERYHSAKDVSRDLRQFKRESGRTMDIRPSQESIQGPGRPSRSDLKRHPMMWSMVALLLIGGGLALGLSLSRSPERRSVVRSFLLLPDSVILPYGWETEPAIISPDGRQIAFVGLSAKRRRMLYVQPLAETAARQLPGTEGATYPFWSPDSRSIGFVAGGKLKKISVAGGSPVTICASMTSRGGSWASDGTILLAPTIHEPLYRVSEGRTPVAVTKLDSSRREDSHRWPWFLPDGTHYLYYARTTSLAGEAENDAIYAASVDGSLNRILLKTSGYVAYASGYLLFMNKATLMAQRFDPVALQLTGEPIPLADNVLTDVHHVRGAFSVSQTGVLVYQTGGETGGARLMIVDRNGREVSKLGDVAVHSCPRFSPDGRSLAVSIHDMKSHSESLWLYDLRRGDRTRLTSGISSDTYAVWSPGGDRIFYYSSSRPENPGIYQRTAGGIRDERLLYGGRAYPTDCSADANWLLFTNFDVSTGKSAVWALQLGGERKAFPLFSTDFSVEGGRLSPDGKWVAYLSDETGENEVFVRPFPGPGQAVRVSLSGGLLVGWHKNGKELTYLNNNDEFVAVDITVRGGRVEAGTARVLFTAPVSIAFYDLSPDGTLFVMCQPGETPSTAHLRLVQHWDADLSD